MKKKPRLAFNYLVGFAETVVTKQIFSDLQLDTSDMELREDNTASGLDRALDSGIRCYFWLHHCLLGHDNFNHFVSCFP